MSITPKQYGYDPTAEAIANRVVGEVHDIGTGELRTLVPLYGPFYAHTVKLYDRRDGTKLIPNVQYKTLYLDETLSLKTRYEVCGVIAITDKSLPDSLEVDLHYQVVGGEYTDYQQLILQMLRTHSLDERGVGWSDIKGKPEVFNPEHHLHDVGDTYGWEFVVNQLQHIREAILLSDKAVHDEILRVFDDSASQVDADIESVRDDILDRLQQHKDRTDNPHGTTKSQVGLGQAPNYPPADEPTTVLGESDDTLVVPRGAKRAIEEIAGVPLQAHIDRDDNPHYTTKHQLELGNVENLPVATDEQARLGQVNSVYITPHGVKLLINEHGIKPLNTHKNRTDNPHGTTKAQIGLGLAPNYPPTTVAIAIQGQDDETLMTPLTTWAAIQTLFTDPITDHKANTNNPHGITKAQLGLGQVGNYSRTYYDARYAAIDHTHDFDTLPFDQVDVLRWNQAASDLENVEGFNPFGTYPNLRAGATTKADVGLPNMPNWGEAEFNARYATVNHGHSEFLTTSQAASQYATKSSVAGIATFARDYAAWAVAEYVTTGSGGSQPTFP